MSDDNARTPEDAYAELFEVNTAIVGFTREKIIEVLALAELHSDQAQRYREIAEGLAALANDSAKLIAQGIATELGLRDEEEDGDDDD